MTKVKKNNSNSSIDLLLINPAWIDHNIRNVFSLFLHKLVSYCPLGLLYLAANAKKNEYQVKIYDMELNHKLPDLLKYIKKENPKVVGVTALTPTYLNALSILKEIKDHFPKIVTIIGGLHISKNPKDAIKKKIVDFELIGEADHTLILLMDNLIKKKNTLKNIPGLIYKEGNHIKVNDGFPIIEDLDTLPFPALDLVDKNRYFVSFQKYHPSTIIMGSRGCPYKCTFCDKLSDKVRFRSPENIISEIKFMYNRYQIRDFQFYDLSFNVNKNWVKELCKKLIEEKLPIAWRCTARVELIDEDLIKLMKQAGCYLIAFGVESANNKSLKFLKKGFTVKDIIKAFKFAKKYKIETHAYYIVGIPGETKSKFLNTVILLKSIAPDYVNPLILIPIPHTELYEISLEKGWLDISNGTVSNPVLKFQKGFTLKYNEMTPNQIIKMKRISMIAFYLNIKWIIHLFFKFLKEPDRFIFNMWRSIKEIIKIF